MRDEFRKTLSGTTAVVWCLFVAWIFLSLPGCASHVQPVLSPPGIHPDAAPEDRLKPDMGWWSAKFKLNWSGNEEPAWHNDLIIAHRVVAPVLDRYHSRIPLWRFHRRAANDPSGHQFSFLFYSTARDAQKIFESIRSSTVLDAMKTAGLVVREIYDDTSSIQRPGIESVSDKNWSPPLCRSWPYFIMGVSETWLGLIREFAGDVRLKAVRIEEMSVLYREVNEKITSIWAQEGRHAYLHHLNAVFGYAPMNVGGKDVRF